VLCFCLAIGAFVLMAVVFTPEFQAVTKNLRPLDLNRQLDVDTMYREVATYTDQSRSVYLRFASADFIYPLAAASFFALLWSRMFRNSRSGFATKLKSSGIMLVPFLFMLIDWLENIGFLIVIFGYPDQYPGVAASATALKGIKSYVLYSVILVTLMFAAAVARRSWQTRGSASGSIN